LPMSEWIVIQQTSPIIISILAVFMVNEKFDKKHLVVVLTSMAGIVLIAKPPFLFPTADSSDSVTMHLLGVLFSFLGAFLGCIVQLLIKKLGKSSTIVIIFYFGLMGTIIFPITMAVEGYANVDSTMIMIGLALIGVLSFLGQGLKNRAFLYGKAANISMMGYASIIFSFLLDIFYFKLYPDTLSIVGSGLIVAGILVIVIQKNSKGDKGEVPQEDAKETITEAITAPEQEEHVPDAAACPSYEVTLYFDDGISASLNENSLDNQQGLLSAQG